MKSRNLMVALPIGAAFSGNLAAAPITFGLDQSDVLADGAAYLQVTVGQGLDGAIDFTVQVLDPLREFAGGRFGIQSFALNVVRAATQRRPASPTCPRAGPRVTSII